MGALILAAGKGTRMKTEAPKVLARLLDRPMLWYTRQALAALCGDRVLAVVGHGAGLVEAAFPDWQDRFVLQAVQRGTGHALATALPRLVQAGYEYVLVVNGDTPLVTSESLDAFVGEALAARADLAFVSIRLPDAGTYGRVVRRDGTVAIIEAKDFDPARHGPATGEVNAGAYLLRLAGIAPLVAHLSDDNASGEYYITDLVALAQQAGLAVLAIDRGPDAGYLGINTPTELVTAEDLLRARIVDAHLAAGVIIRSRDSARIGPEVSIAAGVDLCGPVELSGRTVISAGAVIDANTHVRDSAIGSDARIHAFSHLEGAEVGPGCQVGPFARLRPGAVLMRESRVGNFVEMKKSVLGPGAKASHLTYLGDATVGAAANIGAGTITCNYDAVDKHQTVIGEKAFIGSNSALVAPVTIGAGALVGAGSVITHDVPDGALAVARGRQVTTRRR